LENDIIRLYNGTFLQIPQPVPIAVGKVGKKNQGLCLGVKILPVGLRDLVPYVAPKGMKTEEIYVGLSK
jgi:hypothetical protein